MQYIKPGFYEYAIVYMDDCSNLIVRTGECLIYSRNDYLAKLNSIKTYAKDNSYKVTQSYFYFVEYGVIRCVFEKIAYPTVKALIFMGIGALLYSKSYIWW